MKKFLLQIREHDETGDPGISILRGGRDYFDPAYTGLVIAHDILEHPATPHVNGYIDELMALGGMIAGRVETGWCGQRGRMVSVGDDIRSDICSLATAAFHSCEDMCPKTNTRTVRDSDLIEDIRHAVAGGLKDAGYETETGDLSTDVDIESVVGWICEGYTRYKIRFSKNIFDVSNYLFDKITRVCDNWAKGAEMGDNATLRVDFTRLDVRLEPEYE
jgi:hypothetical protein